MNETRVSRRQAGAMTSRTLDPPASENRNYFLEALVFVNINVLSSSY